MSLAKHVSTALKTAEQWIGGSGQRRVSGAQPGTFNRRVRLGVLHTVLALALVAAVTAAVLLAGTVVPLTLAPAIYFVPVLIAATRWGFWPAAMAAIASTLATQFFFFAPYYSFAVDSLQDAADLLLFLVVAFVCSRLAARVRREADASHQREEHIQRLHEFSRNLALCVTADDLVRAIQSFASAALGRRAVFVAALGGTDCDALDAAAVPEHIRHEAMAMTRRNDSQTRTAFDDKRNHWILRSIASTTVQHGVIAVDVGSPSGSEFVESVAAIEAIIGEAAATLQRIDIGRAMDEARIRMQSDLLKNALHGVVSHELRTPLTSMLGTSSVLLATPAIQNDRMSHALVDAIHDEATQLERFLENLISASRVTGGSVQPLLEWSDPADIVNAAIRRRTRQLRGHRVELVLADDLPIVKVDAVLLEEAVGQLLDNAAKYSPRGSQITIKVGSNPTGIEFSVLDEGVGLAPDELGQLGRKSFRGRRHLDTVPGFGLGLWIASAFVTAMGGKLRIEGRTRHAGTAASISFPASITAHLLEPADD